MIMNVKKIMKWLNVTKSLFAEICGIYVANCGNCSAQYVGQTKINFQLDGITIDTLGKNLIFQPKTIVALSRSNINPVKRVISTQP